MTPPDRFPASIPYIWPAGLEPAPRNTFVQFRKTFALPTAQRSEARIFADSRYWLWVNGAFVGWGPARFAPDAPEYDHYSVQWQAGPNVIAVLVHHWGEPNARYIPARGGLIFDAGVAGVASDATWRARVAPAWEPLSPRIGFQLAYTEIYDARRDAGDWLHAACDDAAWAAAEPVADPPWGPLARRTLPPFTLGARLPARPVRRGRVQCAEAVYDLHLWLGSAQAPPRGYWVHTAVYAPAATRATFRALSSARLRAWLEGSAMPLAEPALPPPTLRQPLAYTVTLDLAAGWQDVAFAVAPSPDVATLTLMVPDRLDLKLASDRDPDHDGLFYTREFVGALPGEAPTAPGDGWRAHLPAATRGSVARFLDAEQLAGDQPCGDYPLAMQAGDWALLALDREALGQVELDVEAPAGVTVDLGYAEHLTDAEGRASFSAGRVVAVKQATFSADRYITAEGRQQHTTFDARGFRFVHVVARGPLTLHRLGVRDATYPAAQVGRFACSDDLLTRIWEVGAHTARLCMEDAFTDCPWRERGQWVGDLKITYLTNLATLGDHRVMARGLRQFALSQGADGHVNGLFPIPWQGGRIAEYSLIWCMAVRDYVHYSGDVATARFLWPHVARALAFFEARLTPEGLTYTRQPWADLILSGAVAAEDVGEVGPLIDWVKTERVGALTTVNAFFYRALRDAAEIGLQVGEGEAAARYGALADRVAGAINRLLWDAGRGVYADARRDGALSPLATVHGNSLVLAFGVAPPARWRAMFDFLRAELAHLYRDDPSIPTFFRQVVSPYFMYYVLCALFAIGQGRYALDQIRAKWGHMLQTGTTTFWENFDPDTSLCHGWASSPTWFLSREVLGVAPVAGADPVRIAPRTCGLAWASGTVPTPGGPVAVAWRDQGEALSLRVALPAGRGVAIESEKPLADVAVNGAAIITPDGALPGVEVAPDRRRATYPHPHGPA